MILTTETIITIVVVAASTLQLRGVCNSVKKSLPAGLENNSAIHPIKNKKLLLIIVLKFKCTFGLSILPSFRVWSLHFK
jgi:hypothetical protein